MWGRLGEIFGGRQAPSAIRYGPETAISMSDLGYESHTDNEQATYGAFFRRIPSLLLWIVSIPVTYLKSIQLFQRNQEHSNITVLQNRDHGREMVGNSSSNTWRRRENSSFAKKFHEISTRRSGRQYKQEDLLVAAIDFGTTYSGWTLSLVESGSDEVKDNDSIGERLVSERQPTSVLIQPDGRTFDCFGYEAEEKYGRLAANKSHKRWYFFKRFKTLLSGSAGNIDRKIKLKDWTGKEIPAQIVFSSAIEYLRREVVRILKETLPEERNLDNDIKWALNVPGNWSDAAKQFMREAAQKAGIPNQKLTISLESEAASLFCKQLRVKQNIESTHLPTQTFESGKKYIILVAGGGSVDITVHEIMRDGSIREIEKATGGEFGGTKVDEAFEMFLSNITGQGVIITFKEEYPSDYMTLFKEFDNKKKLTSPYKTKESNIVVKIPTPLINLVQQIRGRSIQDCILRTSYKDKLSMVNEAIVMDQDIMKSFFESTINGIIEQVETLLEKSQVAKSSAIVMVGGLAESPMLQQGVQKRFSQLEVIVPEDASLAVVEGIAMYGQHPETVSERICRFTYGYETTHDSSFICVHPAGKKSLDENGTMRCWDVFRIMARIGQAVKVGEEGQEFINTPLYDYQTSIGYNIYASTRERPYFVTDPGCIKLGELTVQIPNTSLGTNRKFGIRFIFGGTEIKVKVVDKSSRQIYTTSVDFLG